MPVLPLANPCRPGGSPTSTQDGSAVRVPGPTQVGMPVLTPLGGIIGGIVSLGIIGTVVYFLRR